MEIMFANQQQVALAQLLWNCDTLEEARKVVKTHGTEAEIVYNMIIAEATDQQLKNQESFPEAMAILEALK